MVAMPLDSPAPPSRIARVWPYVVGWIGLFVAYLTVMSLTGETAAGALVWSLANVAPAVLLGTGAQVLIRDRVATEAVGAQLVWHIALATVFVAGWYFMLVPISALGVFALSGKLEVFWLTGPALPWQLFQGLTIYAVVAATTYALMPRATVAAAPRRGDLKRYLMRRGDDLRPVDVDDIEIILGADDYSEVHTAQGVHLARMTLAAFERELDPARFVRVHRSAIINFDRLSRAEPAGTGRMLAHMETGAIAPVSRAGARLLRDRLV